MQNSTDRIYSTLYGRGPYKVVDPRIVLFKYIKYEKRIIDPALEIVAIV